MYISFAGLFYTEEAALVGDFSIVVKLYVDVDRNMPSVDQLMQEWPTGFEDLLNKVCVASLLSFLTVLLGGS